MRIHKVGRETYYEGKRLFDILCRLKNFGVGRIVVRNHYLEKYPEPTYYVVKRVEPDMSDPTQADEDCVVRSLAFVRKIFRGQDFGEQMTTACYKSDWKLVPRSEEHKYLNAVKKPLPPRYVPEYIHFPPLLKHMIMLEKQQKGEPLDETPMLPIKSVLAPEPELYSET